jgi:hypothetical protein
MIWSVAPSETPFCTAVGRTTAKAVLHEWQTDTLRAPGATAHIEGDDITAFDSVTPTVRLGNYTQILTNTLVVSGTADQVDKAGRKTELSYQLLKKGKEIRLDVEFMCVGTNTAKAAGATLMKEPFDVMTVGRSRPILTKARRERIRQRPTGQARERWHRSSVGGNN